MTTDSFYFGREIKITKQILNFVKRIWWEFLKIGRKYQAAGSSTVSCSPHPSQSCLSRFGHQILYTNIEGTRRPQSVPTILTETVVLCKHLPSAVRYQDTAFKSPLIFHSASILSRSLYLSLWFDLFYIIFSWIFLKFLNCNTPKNFKGGAELIAKCLFSYSTLATSWPMFVWVLVVSKGTEEFVTGQTNVGVQIF